MKDSLFLLRQFWLWVKQNEGQIVQILDKSWEKISSQKEVEAIKEWLQVSKSGSPQPTNAQQSGIGYINKELRSLWNGNFSIKFNGMFVHQTPKVKPWSLCFNREIKGSCEIGDLITLLVFLDENDDIFYISSLILQAKLDKGHIPSCQDKLYREEKFCFITPKSIWQDSVIKHPQRFWDRQGLGYLYLLLSSPNPSAEIEFVKARLRAGFGKQFGLFLRNLAGVPICLYKQYRLLYRLLSWFPCLDLCLDCLLNRCLDYIQIYHSIAIWDIIREVEKSSSKKWRLTSGNDPLWKIVKKFNDFDDINKNNIPEEGKEEGEKGFGMLLTTIKFRGNLEE